MRQFLTLVFLLCLVCNVFAESVIDLEILIPVKNIVSPSPEEVVDSGGEDVLEDEGNSSPTGFLGLGGFLSITDLSEFFQDVNSDFDYEKYIQSTGLPCDGFHTHRCIDFNVSLSESIDYDRCIGSLNEGGLEYPAEVCIAGPIAIKDHNNILLAEAVADLQKEIDDLEELTDEKLGRKVGQLADSQTEQEKRAEARNNSIYLILIVILIGGIGYVLWKRNVREGGQKPPDIFEDVADDIPTSGSSASDSIYPVEKQKPAMPKKEEE